MEELVAKLSTLIEQVQDVLTDLKESIKKPIEEAPREPYEPITYEQEEEIRYLCRDYPDMLQDMLTRLHLENLSEMAKSEYREHIERMRKIINARNIAGS